MKIFLKRRIKRSEAGRFVTDAYRMVLGREPDELGLEAHRNALVSGRIDRLSLLQHLLESEEGIALRQNTAAFVERRTRLSTNAEEIVTEAYELAFGRPPDVAGMKYHSDALRTGQQDDFGLLRDLLKSPESEACLSRGARIQPQGVSEEIVLLIQELIAIRLTERGCTWAVPPIFPSGSVIPPAHVTGLIRTLVMLCETPPALEHVH
ncbi:MULTISPECIES: DUF4214 domain-containing protein [unclassified Sphingobium]|uniref:DUF4214 domain-containing protein n=1 Tax=unclassified Sphingobium TaxID=2611147 RepID=UPI002224A76E|nr:MULTISPECIES: DUF4214 domain-containing protein [unclassified Sphingobium]MCW2382883.1 hypothetical protein [Sphingobium sp. B2D3B]MCW2396944.1 hypothetical protein [Sphingobium sp. B2D3C]